MKQTQKGVNFVANIYIYIYFVSSVKYIYIYNYIWCVFEAEGHHSGPAKNIREREKSKHRRLLFF